jgi:hypothetical protein
MTCVGNRLAAGIPPEKEMIEGSAANAISRLISDERIPRALWEKRGIRPPGRKLPAELAASRRKVPDQEIRAAGTRTIRFKNDGGIDIAPRKKIADNDEPARRKKFFKRFKEKGGHRLMKGPDHPE